MRYKKNPTYWRDYARKREARMRRVPGYMAEKNHKYQLAHPEEYAAAMSRGQAVRRAREAGASGSYTSREWLELKADYGGRCAYCGARTRLTADHVVPIALGGANSIDNIVPACGSCNSSKNAKPLLVWMWQRVNTAPGAEVRGRDGH